MLCPRCGEQARVQCNNCGWGDQAEVAGATGGPQVPGVDFVLDEIGRWRREGLITAALAGRLAERYRPAAAPSPREPTAEEWPRLHLPVTPGLVLVYIGGILVLAAAGFVVAHAWEDLQAPGRFALTALPTLILYGAGAWVWLTSAAGRTAGAVMLLVAGLMLPLALVMGALALGYAEEARPLHVIALISLAVHLATLAAFRSPILTIAPSLSLLWAAFALADMLQVGFGGTREVAGVLTACGLLLTALGFYAAEVRRPAYAVMPDVVGVSALLLGLALLGAEYRAPAWEGLALTTSIGFIFGSIWRRNQRYLGLGALFTIVNIFAIGFEYFSETLGYPLVLLICGLAAIAGGYAVHRIRREYILE